MSRKSRGDRNEGLGRRQLLSATGQGLGGLALATLLGGRHRSANAAVGAEAAAPMVTGPMPQARRAIWLTMAGAPSQLDLFDYKPGLAARFNQDLPDSVRNGQRLGSMSAAQKRLPIAPSAYSFAQYGQSGTWVSELLPWTAKCVDDIAVVRSMHTEALNHDQGLQEILTGSQLPGKASVGAWLSYGLGSSDSNLPTFVVMVAQPGSPGMVPTVTSRMWGSAFLPGSNAGVKMRSAGEPVLYLDDPRGVSGPARRTFLDGVKAINQHSYARLADPEIATRINQYELAFRMQSAVPELTDLSSETAATRDLYGPGVDTPGTFAAECLLARRMLEKGVRFVQIVHQGWDSHNGLPIYHPEQCKLVDHACYGLLTDLKQRGLLEDTMVIWGGEFGRTVYCEGELTATTYGRDHHPLCFTMWIAGGGVKPGIVHGETDDFSYNIVRDGVHVRDLHATILQQFGFDPLRLTVRSQGQDQKLVGVDPSVRVVREILLRPPA